MSYISALFASLMALSVSASSMNYVELEQSRQRQDWILIGTSDEGFHEVQRSSISELRSPLATEFIFRTRYHSPKLIGGRSVSYILERTLILCNEDMLITMSQRQVDTLGRSVNYEKAVVYVNPEIQNNIVTETISWACGVTPEYMKQPTRGLVI